jgi:ribosomal protein S18 acetylase RimI-like enzyme
MTTPSHVAIRPATVDDADTLVDAWVALAEEQRRHGSQLLPEPNRTAVREDLSRRAVLGEALVARLTDDAPTDAGETVPTVEDVAPGEFDDDSGLPSTFVGFVSFGLSVDGFERSVVRGVVHNLYVRPDARSAGVGAAILSAAETALRKSGAERVSLEALAGNERALDFYRRHGYDDHRVELEKPLD